MQPRLELGHRALDVTGSGSHGPRHPVHRAELVDDRSLDARDRVRLELDVAAGVVALDRSDQTEETVGDQVALLDVRRETAPQAARHVLDQRCVREDEAVAERLVGLVLAELEPESLGVVYLRHGRKDTAQP